MRFNCTATPGICADSRLCADANHFLNRGACNPGMAKTVLMTLIFLSSADIVLTDGRYSESAGHMAQKVWYEFVGR